MFYIKKSISEIKNFLVILVFVISKVQNIFSQFFKQNSKRTYNYMQACVQLCFEFHKIAFWYQRIDPKENFVVPYVMLGKNKRGARERKEMRGEGKEGKRNLRNFPFKCLFVGEKVKETQSISVSHPPDPLFSLPFSSQFQEERKC